MTQGLTPSPTSCMGWAIVKTWTTVKGKVFTVHHLWHHPTSGLKALTSKPLN